MVAIQLTNLVIQIHTRICQPYKIRNRDSYHKEKPKTIGEEMQKFKSIITAVKTAANLKAKWKSQNLISCQSDMICIAAVKILEFVQFAITFHPDIHVSGHIEIFCEFI